MEKKTCAKPKKDIFIDDGMVRSATSVPRACSTISGSRIETNHFLLVYEMLINHIKLDKKSIVPSAENCACNSGEWGVLLSSSSSFFTSHDGICYDANHSTHEKNILKCIASRHRVCKETTKSRAAYTI